jgi:hypothetical protein
LLICDKMLANCGFALKPDKHQEKDIIMEAMSKPLADERLHRAMVRTHAVTSWMFVAGK